MGAEVVIPSTYVSASAQTARVLFPSLFLIEARGPPQWARETINAILAASLDVRCGSGAWPPSLSDSDSETLPTSVRVRTLCSLGAGCPALTDRRIRRLATGQLSLGPPYPGDLLEKRPDFPLVAAPGACGCSRGVRTRMRRSILRMSSTSTCVIALAPYLNRGPQSA